MKIAKASAGYTIALGEVLMAQHMEGSVSWGVLFVCAVFTAFVSGWGLDDFFFPKKED